MQSTCAVTGEGIFDGLDWLAETVKRNKSEPCPAAQVTI
jgi:hypothetical protein